MGLTGHEPHWMPLRDPGLLDVRGITQNLSHPGIRIEQCEKMPIALIRRKVKPGAAPAGLAASSILCEDPSNQHRLIAIFHFGKRVLLELIPLSGLRGVVNLRNGLSSSGPPGHIPHVL